MSWTRAVSALTLLLLSVACGQDTHAETAIAVSIKSDLIASQEIASVHLRVYELGVDPNTAPPMLDFPNQPIADLARPTLVLKGSRTEVLIVVQGLGPDGVTPVVVQRVRAQFMDGKTYNLPVHLARVCKAKNCGEMPGQTCYGFAQGGVCEGACGPIPVGESAGVLDDEDSPLPTASWSPRSCGDAGVVAPPVLDSGPPPCDAGVGACVTSDAGADAASDAAMDAGTCTPSAPGAPCSLARQCGCGVGSELSCTVEVANSVASVECLPPGAKREGVTCTKHAECAAGLACVDSICSKFCDTNQDCGGSSVCVGVALGGGGGTPLNFKVCGERCTDNSGCATNCCQDDFCRPATSCMPAAPTCTPAGQSCTANAECCAGAPYCVASASGAKTCSATPTSVAPSCPSPADASACRLCDDANCCAQWTACANAPACAELLTCRGACGVGDTTCLANCSTQNPNGLPTHQAWLSCVLTSCATQCN